MYFGNVNSTMKQERPSTALDPLQSMVSSSRKETTSPRQFSSRSWPTDAPSFPCFGVAAVLLSHTMDWFGSVMQLNPLSVFGNSVVSVS